MSDTFFIRSPAGVPWQFSDCDRVLIGDAPGLIAQITRDRDNAYNVLLTNGGVRIFSEGPRAGLAKAVAFALQSGDRIACSSASRCAFDSYTNVVENGSLSTDGPSTTVSFSQSREFSGGDW